MEYYKILYFKNKKHIYDISRLFNYDDGSDNNLIYENKPIINAKITQNGILDPETGYFFRPSNMSHFLKNSKLSMYLLNGICSEPLIFSYSSDGCFEVFLYKEVSDQLLNVSMETKEGLDNICSCELLRDIENDIYYFNLGIAGVIKNSSDGNPKLTKKHALLKLRYIQLDKEKIIISPSSIKLLEPTKAAKIKYHVIKTFDNNNILFCDSYHAFRSDDDVDVMSIENFIDSSYLFDFEAFSKTYSNYVFSRTVRALVNYKNIKVRNKITTVREDLGIGSIEMRIPLEYIKHDLVANTVEIKTPDEQAKDNIYLYFNDGSNSIEIDNIADIIVETAGKEYLITMESLYCYNLRARVDIHSGLNILTDDYSNMRDVKYYAILNNILINSNYVYNESSKIALSLDDEYINKNKLIFKRVKYLLNDSVYIPLTFNKIVSISDSYKPYRLKPDVVFEDYIEDDFLRLPIAGVFNA